MKRNLILMLLGSCLALPALLGAAANLRLNPKLDYSSDSQDGPLITGDQMEDGAVRGEPNYISKRQARRSVNLYEKYKGRVNFVIIDLDRKRSPAQQELVKKYYQGYIPHVAILDKSGNAVYNSSGEVEESRISTIFDTLLNPALRF